VSKFSQLVEPILGKERAAQLSSLAQSATACPDVRVMTALTRP